MGDYLNFHGLSRFYNRLKNRFVDQTDSVSSAEIDAMFENIPGSDWDDIITVQEVLTEMAGIKDVLGSFHFSAKYLGGDSSAFDIVFDEAPSSGTPILFFGRLGWSSSNHKYVGLIVFEEDGTPIVLSVAGRWTALSFVKVSTYRYTLEVESGYARLFFISPVGMSFPS